jgi:hypothetical protein
MAITQKIKAFSISNNPDLVCVEVDSVEYALNNWQGFDSSYGKVYSENCGF